MAKAHFELLKEIYLKAPLHVFYDTLEITISKKKCSISLEVDSKYFHGGGAVHGSVYFKLLDDAAYFAVQSEILDKFMLTKTFEIQFLRPISTGKMIAKGEVTQITETIFHAEAKLYNGEEKLIGKGSGEFVKGRVFLEKLNF